MSYTTILTQKSSGSKNVGIVDEVMIIENEIEALRDRMIQALKESSEEANRIRDDIHNYGVKIEEYEDELMKIASKVSGKISKEELDELWDLIQPRDNPCRGFKRRNSFDSLREFGVDFIRRKSVNLVGAIDRLKYHGRLPVERGNLYFSHHGRHGKQKKDPQLSIPCNDSCQSAEELNLKKKLDESMRRRSTGTDVHPEENQSTDQPQKGRFHLFKPASWIKPRTESTKTRSRRRRKHPKRSSKAKNLSTTSEDTLSTVATTGTAENANGHDEKTDSHHAKNIPPTLGWSLLAATKREIDVVHKFEDVASNIQIKISTLRPSSLIKTRNTENMNDHVTDVVEYEARIMQIGKLRESLYDKDTLITSLEKRISEQQEKICKLQEAVDESREQNLKLKLDNNYPELAVRTTYGVPTYPTSKQA